MAGLVGEVRVGPAGWSYEDWKGIVYPAPMPKSLHPLTLLSQWFDTVEVNASFYRPPVARTCATWLGKVAGNGRFMFTAKLWERFTHQRNTPFTTGECALFKEGLHPLLEAGRLGALLIQFPWSFKRTPESRAWLARVTDAFHEYPLAVEVRHASWDCAEVYEGLAARGIAFCNVDQPMFEGSLGPADAVTGRVGYVRLHGRNQADWFRQEASRDDRYNYLYSEEELTPWLERISSIRAKAESVYVVTNNHYRGQAVVNAVEIAERLGRTDFALPRSLIDEYPRLGCLLKRDTQPREGEVRP